MLFLRLCVFAFIFCMCSPMIGNTISLPLMGNVEEVGGRRESQRMPEELICNEAIAQDLLEIFRELYKAKYKIERISLIDNYGADDTRSMEANNTSCFSFRFMTGSTTRISKHGMGLAIDINPLYNPYVKGNKIDPPSGARYAKNRDKRKDIPMKIDRNDLCYKLFIKHGFKWGGAWKSSKDYQHFEK